jgi:hypothetical protein
MDGIDATIARKGDRTFYEVRVPVALVDLPKLEQGMAIGFALLVNDSDGKGREGFLEWACGIGRTKSSALFNWLVFGP